MQLRKQVKTLSNVSYSMAAGLALKHLIRKHYPSQQSFADDYGIELRTVNRYVTSGIGKMVTIEEAADFFQMDVIDFLRLGKSLAEESEMFR